MAYSTNLKTLSIFVFLSNTPLKTCKALANTFLHHNVFRIGFDPFLNLLQMNCSNDELDEWIFNEYLLYSEKSTYSIEKTLLCLHKQNCEHNYINQITARTVKTLVQLHAQGFEEHLTGQASTFFSFAHHSLDPALKNLQTHRRLLKMHNMLQKRLIILYKKLREQ